MDITYTFTRGQQQEVKPIHQWVHSAAEIRRMLWRSGLEPVAAFGDLEGSPYVLGLPRFIVLAQRTGLHEIARRVAELFQYLNSPADRDNDLTAHEIRILKLLVDGHNYKTAAAELEVSVNTIRFHLRSIYEKLQVHSKSEAVAKGLRQRIVR
jgi:DNA-binding CsgD family transcriptional regulator